MSFIHIHNIIGLWRERARTHAPFRIIVFYPRRYYKIYHSGLVSSLGGMRWQRRKGSFGAVFKKKKQKLFYKYIRRKWVGHRIQSPPIVCKARVSRQTNSIVFPNTFNITRFTAGYYLRCEARWEYIYIYIHSPRSEENESGVHATITKPIQKLLRYTHNIMSPKCCIITRTREATRKLKLRVSGNLWFLFNRKKQTNKL